MQSENHLDPARDRSCAECWRVLKCKPCSLDASWTAPRARQDEDDPHQKGLDSCERLQELHGQPERLDETWGDRSGLGHIFDESTIDYSFQMLPARLELAITELGSAVLPITL